MPRVDPDTAHQHAIFHFLSKAIAPTRAPGLEGWAEAKIEEPIPFFDLLYGEKNDPVVYICDVVQANGVVGFIGITGSTAFGTTLAFMRPMPSSATKTRVDQIRSDVLSRPENAGADVFPVVYSYPKCGVCVARTNGTLAVVDLFTLDTVLDGPYEPGSLLDEPQGLMVWSFWDNFPQAGANDSKWTSESVGIARLIGNGVSISGAHRPIKTFQAQRDQFATNMSRSLKPHVSQHLFPIDSLGQETNIYCAPTCLQMMQKYVFGESSSQEEIAGEMQITAAGSTLSGQLRAYQKYFGDKFVVSVDRSPTEGELLSKLSEYLPVKCGIKGHARLISGFRRETYVDPIDGKIVLEETSAMVSDPEPVGSGSIVWENSKINNWNDFVTITRK